MPKKKNTSTECIQRINTLLQVIRIAVYKENKFLALLFVVYFTTYLYSIALNCRMTGERKRFLRKQLQPNGGTTPSFAWREYGKSQKTLARIACLSLDLN
jgi:hypothetical protein